jgi:hypothetical protein
VYKNDKVLQSYGCTRSTIWQGIMDSENKHQTQIEAVGMKFLRFVNGYSKLLHSHISSGG